jgi:hypothetical protein
MALFKFYCDESFDSDPHQDRSQVFSTEKKPYVQRTFVVAGFFAPERIWTKVERRWARANQVVGVSRYHGANVNARSGEFEGWPDSKRNRYSKRLLKILRDQGKHLHAISCGMFVRDYERIIDEPGKKKLGHPYIACFNGCIAMVARGMSDAGFAPEDKFEVVFDRNEFELEAVEIFYKLADATGWRFHARLATCQPGSSAEIPALQAADLIAYETFKLLHRKHSGNKEVRRSLASMFADNLFAGYYYEEDTLRQIKGPLDASTSGKNEFIVNFPIQPSWQRYPTRTT